MLKTLFGPVLKADIPVVPLKENAKICLYCTYKKLTCENVNTCNTYVFLFTYAPFLPAMIGALETFTNLCNTPEGK